MCLALFLGWICDQQELSSVFIAPQSHLETPLKCTPSGAFTMVMTIYYGATATPAKQR
jgi:hypothetical protein